MSHQYKDLRDFIALLKTQGKLKRVAHPVSPHLEMTEIADRVLRAEGPALLFENPIKPDGTRYDYPANRPILHDCCSRRYQ